MKTTLKPCPFCGGDADVYEIPDFCNRFVVGCGVHLNIGNKDVLCAGNAARFNPLLTFSTKEQAVAAWNRRAEGGAK